MICFIKLLHAYLERSITETLSYCCFSTLPVQNGSCSGPNVKLFATQSTKKLYELQLIMPQALCCISNRHSGVLFLIIIVIHTVQLLKIPTSTIKPISNSAHISSLIFSRLQRAFIVQIVYQSILPIQQLNMPTLDSLEFHRSIFSISDDGFAFQQERT